jgi:bile acid-coenzyme A ligase
LPSTGRGLLPGRAETRTLSRIPYGSVLTRLAHRTPERIALICGEDAIAWGALEASANRLARAFEAQGVRLGDIVSLVLPNGIELVTSILATWKLGAVPNPLAPAMPAAELAAVLKRADPKLIVGGEAKIDANSLGSATRLPAGYAADASLSSGPLDERIAPHERALASGGSTGLPKLILPKAQAVYDTENHSVFARARRVAGVPGPLYHAAPFSACFQPLFAGCQVVLMKRFDPRLFLAMVERHAVDRVTVVPTMMLRIMRLPPKERLAYDVSSLECVMSGGAPLPEWLMQAWIDWLGPDVMNEVFGPSERIGGTAIGGREWLEHRGSVGRPVGGAQIKIMDDGGHELPPGEMGEIWMMPSTGPGTTYQYRGAEARLDTQGWESVGDMGYLDSQGYLYLGDRKSDMILSGGQNIYPAEVEAALESHPRVQSSAVIGLPDDDLGQRIHAIVEVDEQRAGGSALCLEEIRDWLGERLVSYKHPRSLECVSHSLRDEAGKLRRSRLREERLLP